MISAEKVVQKLRSIVDQQLSLLEAFFFLLSFCCLDDVVEQDSLLESLKSIYHTHCQQHTKTRSPFYP